MKKRILSTLMALALCLSLLPTAAFAETDTDGGAGDTPVCTCETACTADNMNDDCLVCGAEGAEVTACIKYTATAEPDETPTTFNAYTTDGFCKAYEWKNGVLTEKDNANCTHTDCNGYQPADLKNGVYEISNAGQLYWFAATVNTKGENNTYPNKGNNGKLKTDITLNTGVLTNGALNGDGSDLRKWTPIGNGDNGYTGTFDGGNFTVSGLYFNNTATYQGGSYVGLFGKIDSGGTVKNVKLDDSYIMGARFVGSVAGVCSGTLKDCTSSGAVIGTLNSVGGIVGECSSGGKIENCHNTGAVTGARNGVGGVVGYVAGENKEYVKGDNPGEDYYITTPGGTVKNCTNSGTVTGTGNESPNIGGVAGWCLGTVENCSNSGAVTGAKGYVGGVAGSCDGGTVENCYNTGNVTSTDSSTGYAGGVVGYMQNDGSQESTVENCFNTGKVTGPKGNVGGVVGYQNDGTLTNCFYQKDEDDTLIAVGNNIYAKGAESKTAVEFASGEVTWKLNGEKSDGVWKQTLSTDDKDGDATPTLDSTHGTVYYGWRSCVDDSMTYSNKPLSDASLHQIDDNGYCALCKRTFQVHCLCGATHQKIGDGHTAETNTAFQQWTETTSLPTTAGGYYLTENVNLSGTWAVSADITLCLNGKSINGGHIEVQADKTLTLTDCGGTGTLSGCYVDVLAGETNGKNGTFNLYSGTITGNTGHAGVANAGTFNMYGGSITENGKSGVYNIRTFNMYGGSITKNTTTEQGGGVENNKDEQQNTTFNLYGGTIEGNTAPKEGGGVSMALSVGFNMTGGKICGNTAGKAGGVYVSDGSFFTMTGGEITGNNATESGGGVFASYTFIVEDNAKITGNVVKGTKDATTGLYTGGTASNACLVTDTARIFVRSGFTGEVYVTPASYNKDTKVLKLESGATNAGFKLDDQTKGLFIDKDGKLGKCSHPHIQDGTCPDCQQSFALQLTYKENEEAENDTVKYLNSFADAINTVNQKGGTIKLFKDCTASEVLNLTKSLTLDLNGCTLDKTTYYMSVESGATLTLKNSNSKGGTLKVAKSLIVRSGATAKIEQGVTVQNTSSGSNTQSAIAIDGTVEINGAKVEGYVMVDVQDGSSQGGSLTVTGGDIEQISVFGGTVTLNSGTFGRLKNNIDNGKVSTMLAEGCYYKDANDNGLSYASLGKEVENVTVAKCTDHSVTNGKCTYCNADYAAKLTHNGIDTYCATFNDAYSNAATGDTITLLADAVYQRVHDSDVDDWTKSFTIALNDHALSFKSKDGHGTTQSVRGTGVTIQGPGTLSSKLMVSGQENSSLTLSGAVTCKYVYVLGVLNVSDSSVKVTELIAKPTATIALSAGTFDKITTTDDGLKATDLLADGYGFYTAGANNPWHDKSSSAQKEITFVEVKQLPIQKLELKKGGTTVTKDDTITCSYGEDIMLTAVVTQPTGKSETVSYYWSDTDLNDPSHTSTVIDGATGESLSLSKLNAGEHTLTAHATVGGYIASASVNVTVNRATLTGAPTYTAITTGGKTLAAAALTADASWPEGTLQWVDDNGPLANTTEVKANTAYKWTFTPTVSVNYAPLSGTITLWHKTASSGGGGSSNTSTTTKNEDGSTTTTTTNKVTGTVTETTKNTDGSTTTVETKKDGTVTETNKTPTGTTSTTVTDTNGNSTTTVSVSKKDAQSGETAAIPVDAVKPADKSENATEIKIDVPTGGATVEIPVKDPTPGTVIVIVDKNGNETIVPGSKVTENGIEITLTESATIKVIDNSKNFDDVPENAYFADAVAWASARSITGGVTAGAFGPHGSCTRAQLVTFLWRAAGQPEAKSESGMTDVETGAYYADAVAWAVENGIVGGYGNGLFGAGDTITRQQMAVILYRFAQAMGMDTTQGGMAVREYKDFDSISDYAVAAIQWAVNAGIMQGNDGKLMPSAPCTRAQIVTFLYRLLGK